MKPNILWTLYPSRYPKPCSFQQHLQLHEELQSGELERWIDPPWRRQWVWRLHIRPRTWFHGRFCSRNVTAACRWRNRRRLCPEHCSPRLGTWRRFFPLLFFCSSRRGTDQFGWNSEIHYGLIVGENEDWWWWWGLATAPSASNSNTIGWRRGLQMRIKNR